MQPQPTKSLHLRAVSPTTEVRSKSRVFLIVQRVHSDWLAAKVVARHHDEAQARAALEVFRRYERTRDFAIFVPLDPDVEHDA